MTFLELLSRYGKIEIPRIQRNYAQGRENESIVRNSFLNDLVTVLNSDDADICLDFIYGSVLNYEDIKKLIDDMGNSKLTEISIDFPDGTKIGMKKEVKVVEKVQEKNIQHIEQKEVNEIVETETQEDNCKIVKSPMVGTFYLKPDPNSNPYVEIGKKVKKGDILCIIEAMKLMNEIECEFDGEIAEILVKDGEMVEYGKPLFKIK